jgi:phospholipid/cholesterol/gamma-HCH transport system substrate-binding protein
MDYKKMTYISGIIIFVGFVIVLVAIIWLSTENILFSRDYPIFVKYTEVTGLRDQSPVFMRGYRIGTTKGVQFQDDGIIIKVEINKKFQVPKDSKFAITALNFLGEKAMTITPPPGGATGEWMQPNDMVIGENKDIMTVAQTVLTGLKKRLDENDIGQKIKQFGESMDRLQSFIKKMDDKMDQLDVGHYNEQILSVGDAARQMKEFLQAAQPDVTDIAHQGKETMSKVNSALDQFSSLSQKLDSLAARLNRGEGSAGELLTNKEYVKNLSATIEQLRSLLDDIEKNPRKYLKFSVF